MTDVGIRRRVRLSPDFQLIAEEMFPPEGSADGTPPFAIFAETVLFNAAEAFGRDFERYSGGSTIASFSTSETLFIRKPVRFFARLIADGTEVEIVDVDVDWDYVDIDIIDDEER